MKCNKCNKEIDVHNFYKITGCNWILIVCNCGYNRILRINILPNISKKEVSDKIPFLEFINNKTEKDDIDES